MSETRCFDCRRMMRIDQREPEVTLWDRCDECNAKLARNEGLGPTLWELAEERHQRHIDRVAGTKKRALKPVLDAAVTRQSGSVSRRPKGIEPKTSAPDTIRTCDLSLRKPRADVAFLGNAEHPAHCSVQKSPEESRATVTDAAVTRHRPQAWSLAYAYRDALSRGAAA